MPPSKDYIHLGRMGVPAQEFDGKLPKLYSPYAETNGQQIQDQAVSALHVTQPKATSGKGRPTFTSAREQKTVPVKNENWPR